MVSHRKDISCSGFRTVSTDLASRIARDLIDREIRRHGGTQGAALNRVARRMRINPGLIANLIKRRVKTITADIRDRLVAAAIADIEHEITRLENERTILAALDGNQIADDLDDIEGALA